MVQYLILSLMKIINLVALPKRICDPVQFPLSQQSKQEIRLLKQSFRNSFVDFQLYTLGLSAPQIGVWKRICIMPQKFQYGKIKDFKRLKYMVRHFHTYINPKIVKMSQEMIKFDQTCLSVGQSSYSISRPKIIEIEYYKQDGQLCRQTLDPLRSRVIQHQMDHLQGILMSEKEGAQLSDRAKLTYQ